MENTLDNSLSPDEINLDQDGSQEDQRISTTQRPPTWRDLITAEPVIICFMLAIGMHDPAIKGLTYYKICQEEFNNSHICNNLHNVTFQEQEDKVQSIASHWFLYQHLCFEIPSIIMSFFYGAISDHFSRRVALALPCFGQLLSVANYIFNALYMDSHVGYILIGQAISGLFGGWITCLLASYSLISEMSTKSNRTFRISIGEGCESVSIALAFFVSGVILDHTNYETIFGISIALYSLGIIYCFTWLKKTPRQSHETFKESCGNVFSLGRIKDTLSCVFKKREHRGRLRLITLLVSIFFGMVSYYGKYIHTILR